MFSRFQLADGVIVANVDQSGGRDANLPDGTWSVTEPDEEIKRVLADVVTGIDTE